MSPRAIKNFKPLKDMQVLIDTMLPFSEQGFSRPHKKFYFKTHGVDVIYLILEGTIFLHRVSDGMVVASGHAPLLIGLTNDTLMGDSVYYFTAGTDISYTVLPLLTAMNIIKENKLWQSYSNLQSYLLKFLSANGAEIAALSAYEIICNQLRNLMQESDDIRLKITASTYIQERTRLSRSRIMNILSQLKSGEYIMTSNGMLTSINKLPEKF